MGKPSYQWYIVMYHSRNYHAFAFDSSKQARNFAKGKDLPYKGFMTKEEAVAYAGCKESKIRFQQARTSNPLRVCLVCEKPFKGRTKLCPTCNNLRKRSRCSMSVKSAIALKELHPEIDVLSVAQTDPGIAARMVRSTTASERTTLRDSRAAELRSEEYKQIVYTKDYPTIPDFVKRLLEADKTKVLLYMEGSKDNPKIYYLCKRCGLEHCQTYDSLKAGRGHNCLSLKSSGEVAVEEFLKSIGVDYRLQYDTLKCVNPKTKKIMPYDFELHNHKVIIEVQGEQHFNYEPYFHGSVENYEYQVWRDKYKRDYAEQQGYAVVYINYTDFRDDQYKRIILDRLNC